MADHEQFPPKFLSFLETQGLAVDEYLRQLNDVPCRYVRLNTLLRCPTTSKPIFDRSTDYSADIRDALFLHDDDHAACAPAASSSVSTSSHSCSSGTTTSKRIASSGDHDVDEPPTDKSTDKPQAVHRVQWLLSEQVYAVFPDDFPIARSMWYREGRLFGGDAASAAAIVALFGGEEFARNSEDDPPVLRVLDLCCAPGTKFCHAAEYLSGRGIPFSLVGVDVAEPRLAACDSVVAKYFGSLETFSAANLHLLCADGRTFFAQRDEEFPTNICGTKAMRKKRRRVEARRAARPQSDVSAPSTAVVAAAPVDFLADGPRRTTGEVHDPHEDLVKGSFDFVLVDAECSHEGSVKHVAKYRSQWGVDTMDRRMVWLQQTEKLRTLQLSLLRNGFRNLKPGGVLVYSTCSFCRAQNEDLVAGFLEEVGRGGGVGEEAELVPLFRADGNCSGDSTTPPPCVFSDEGKSMARFDPVVSQTSGLFMAKLRKKARSWEVVDEAEVLARGGKES